MRRVLKLHDQIHNTTECRICNNNRVEGWYLCWKCMQKFLDRPLPSGQDAAEWNSMMRLLRWLDVYGSAVCDASI